MATQPRPLVIGISGGTGSGKTTVARSIIAELPKQSVTLIQHDAYYRDLRDLTDEERARINFDHPDSLDNDLLIEHIDQLCSGEAIDRPNYNFVNHRREEHSTKVTPTPVIIVEGILIFADARLIERFDIRLFIDTPSDIRILRRIRRDMEHRGRSFDDVREQYYKTVRPMHEAFVAPSTRHAHLIIPEGGNRSVAIEVIQERIAGELQGRGWDRLRVRNRSKRS